MSKTVKFSLDNGPDSNGDQYAPGVLEEALKRFVKKKQPNVVVGIDFATTAPIDQSCAVTYHFIQQPDGTLNPVITEVSIVKR